MAGCEALTKRRCEVLQLAEKIVKQYNECMRVAELAYIIALELQGPGWDTVSKYLYELINYKYIKARYMQRLHYQPLYYVCPDSF